MELLRKLLGIKKIAEENERLKELLAENIEQQAAFLKRKGLEEPKALEEYQNLQFLRLRVLKVPIITV